MGRRVSFLMLGVLCKRGVANDAKTGKLDVSRGTC
jgi:hypothetical protein